MRIRTRFIALLGALPLLIGGCTSGSQPAETPADSPTQSTAADPTTQAPLDKVSIVLDWTPNTNHTGLYTAIEQGYYADAGIELEILGYSQAGVESVLGAGGAEFGFSGVDSLLAARAAGVDLTMVINVQQKSSFGVAVSGDSEITRPADLDGRTLAAYGGGATHYNTRQMIKNDGGQGEFEVVVVGTGALEAVLAGRADFAESMATWEGLAMEMQGYQVRFMFPADYDVPTTPALLGISVRDDFLAANPDVVKRFVQATQLGYQFAVDNPERAAQVLLDANPQAKLDPELTLRSQELLSAEYWPDAQGSVGHADLDAWQRYLDHVIGTGLIVDGDGEVFTDAVAAEDLVTNEFLA